MDRAHGGYGESKANQRISNLKSTKESISRTPIRAQYKQQAIDQCAYDMANFFAIDAEKFPNLNKQTTSLLLVPIPPSEARDNPHTHGAGTN